MIKKTITFKNFNDETETEDFYFNLSKGELVKLQLSAVDQKTESFQDKLEKLGKNLQGAEIVEVMDDFIVKSYGVRSTDGKRFVKSPALVEEFKSTGAYSQLIVELFREDGKGFAEFVNGIMPADLRDEVNKEVASAQAARERSEAQMQGFQKKQETPKSVHEVVPELPTSAPVFEGELDRRLAAEERLTSGDLPPVNPQPTQADLTSMSQEELIAHIQAGNVKPNSIA